MSEREQVPPRTNRLREWVAATEPRSLVAELNHLTPDRRRQVFRLLPDDKAWEVFTLLDAASQADLLAEMRDEKVAPWLNAMEPDDRARMLEEVPQRRAESLLRHLEPEELRSTSLLLDYPKESAGRIMSPEFVRLRPDQTAGQALEEVRRQHDRAETLYFLPVVDRESRFLGAVELADLILAPPNRPIADLSRKDIPVVSPYEDQEVVARLITSNDQIAVPVVDGDKRLVGLVTFDDAMDILEYEQSEDIARTGGFEPIRKPYLAVSIPRLVRSRIVWISVLAIAATLTVNVLNAFEATLDEVVSLALFIPFLIGIGGNTGAQSATTVVRALAVDDIRPSDALRVAGREARAGFLLGALVGGAALALVWPLFGRDIAVIVAATLVTICTLGALVGSVMPIIARRLGVDPAVFSTPFVTTIVDASGLMIYFLIANAVLGL